MAAYYIDPVLGCDENDGLSENTPKKDYHNIALKGGDTVLFKCGSFYRAKLDNINGEEGKPITYSFYGEGQKPTFCGSVDTLSNPDIWVEEEKNIWVTEAVTHEEVCNIIFNNTELFGTLCWEKGDLQNQGDYFDNMFGTRLFDKPLPPGHKIYMYSEGNPGKVYNHIEMSVYGKRTLGNAACHNIIDGLRFINSGVHGLAGANVVDLTVRNCDFENIGGCTWNYQRKIRLGNGVECWDGADDVTVTGCYFYNIYDSGVTHQGGADCKSANNVHFDNNVFVKCGMGAYEQRDLMPKYATFNNNVCLCAGEGFSKQGEKQFPRMSEVWPMPMGHHVFLWRIMKATDGGKLEIKNNIFCGAPIGASIYSIIYRCAEEQVELEGNVYCTPNEDELVNRWDGKDFASFEDYKNGGYEKNVKCGKIDISEYLR